MQYKRSRFTRNASSSRREGGHSSHTSHSPHRSASRAPHHAHSSSSTEGSVHHHGNSHRRDVGENRRDGGSHRGGFRRGGFHRGGGNSRGGAPRGRGRVMPTFDVSKFINKNPVVITDEVVYEPKHMFKDFGFAPQLSHIVSLANLSHPTPIQDEIIPHIMQGHDVIGLANTGTGKTAAFLLPLIDKTLRAYDRQTLILTPTRELALQIEAELKRFSTGFRLYATVLVGGTSMGPQIRGLKRKNHFIIGTPGRVLDMIRERHFAPARVTTVVLDEADRMLDMGFIHDVKEILKDTPKDRETLFFSATMSKDIEQLVGDFLRNPVTVSVKKRDITNSIEQDVIRYGDHNKFETLTTLLADPAFKRVLIFGAMKHSVEKLSQQLIKHGIKADSIHGNKSHPQRQRSLSGFKSGQARVLVATDVAARGIHVDNVTHVINYDLPATYEDYVHRIGRTGRGKERGKALTFVQAN